MMGMPLTLLTGAGFTVPTITFNLRICAGVWLSFKKSSECLGEDVTSQTAGDESLGSVRVGMRLL